MHLANKVLHELGATQVFKVNEMEDPSTEEEFNLLQYESPVQITWQQYREKYPEIEKRIGIQSLRLHRNTLLAKSDWVMTVDSFQTLANKNEWIAYRQLLRDLPANPPQFIWKNGDIDVQQMFPTEPIIVRTQLV